jgi:hypothetical protein
MEVLLVALVALAAAVLDTAGALLGQELWAKETMVALVAVVLQKLQAVAVAQEALDLRAILLLVLQEAEELDLLQVFLVQKFFMLAAAVAAQKALILRVGKGVLAVAARV